MLGAGHAMVGTPPRSGIYGCKYECMTLTFSSVVAQNIVAADQGYNQET
jgi:hypothetical protein